MNIFSLAAAAATTAAADDDENAADSESVAWDVPYTYITVHRLLIMQIRTYHTSIYTSTYTHIHCAHLNLKIECEGDKMF